MTDAPTPEVAAYRAAHDATEATLKRLRRRVTIVAIATALAIVALISFAAVKIDQKFSATQSKVAAGVAVIQKVRATQITNTKLSDQRSECQTKALNAGLGDAILAIQGDHNPADYAPIVKC